MTPSFRRIAAAVAGLLVGLGLTACSSASPGSSDSEATAVPAAAGSADIAKCRELFESAPATMSGPAIIVVADRTRSASSPSLSAEAQAAITHVAQAKGTVTIVGVNGRGAAPIVVAKNATLYPAGLTADTPRESRVVAMAPGCVQASAAAALPTKPGSDILAAWQDAASFANASQDATLILITDGLANAGVFDLNKIAPGADPNEIIAAIKNVGELPSTQAKTVIDGLGSSASQRVDAKNRTYLVGVYRDLCQATGAASCDIGSFQGGATSVVNAKAPDDVAVQLGSSPTIVIDQAAKTCDLDLPESVSFDPDSYRLRPSAAEAVAPAIETLKENPSATVTIVGHAATASDDKASLKRFSLMRAKAVAGLLADAGIGPSRIVTVGVGDADQKVDDIVDGQLHEPEAQANRRVELKILGAVCS